MGRIESAFAQTRQRGVPALVPFVTAGDPSLAVTGAILDALVAGGADLIELGFPFSDPMADGPVIQAASERALASGASLSGVLEVVRSFRGRYSTPIVLMGYFNPVFRYGVERFAREAANAGVDGLLLVDLPLEEAEELHVHCRSVGLRLITLVAPTTPVERQQQLAAAAEGYLYYVSMTGVTGSRQVDAAAIAADVERLKGFSPVPVAVGFGIATPEDAAAVGCYADAVVVGSALVKVIAACGDQADLAQQVQNFVSRLRAGLDHRG